MSYDSKYTGQQVEELLEKAGTALQSVPDEYVTATELEGKGYATTEAVNTSLAEKVDKVAGKQLTTEDFTTALKQKLEGLSNYDDTTISEAVNTLREDFDTLVSGDSTTAIKTFNEIIAFLSGIEDSESLDSIIASIEQQIAGKQDTIADLATIREGAGKGATAVQPSNLAKVATSGSYNDLSDKPTIPAAVTVDTALSTTSTNPVQNKAVAAGINAKYTKPSAGIPKSDLATAVQNSLGKADTALQTEQYKGTVTGVKINGTTKNPDTNGLVDLGEISGGSGGGESVQEVYVIDPYGEASEVYAGLKAAWDAGVRSYILMRVLAIPCTVAYIGDLFVVAANVAASDGENPMLQVIQYQITDTEIVEAAEEINLAEDNASYAEVSHGTNDTTFELTPNTFHVWDEVASLTLTLGAETSGVANEYLFQFLSGSTPTTLSLPDDLKWPDDEPFTPEADKMYQLSILKGAVSVLSWENKNIVIINFRIAGTSYQAEEGMSWVQWINSSYNTGGYYISGNIVRFDSMNCVAYQDSYSGIPLSDFIQKDYSYRHYFDD